MALQRLINRIFYGAPAKPAHGANTQAGHRDNPLTIEDGSENATRRQLVQMLMRDLLKRSGIPASWIECQMLLVSSRSKGHGMYVRLIIKHWDRRLLNYTYAFQQALLTDIERFEPKATEWLHGISWQLEPGETCPYITLPEKTYWDSAATKVASKALPTRPVVGVVPPQTDFQPTGTDEENNRIRDLAALFAVRDEELAREIAGGITPVGYEKTQASPL